MSRHENVIDLEKAVLVVVDLQEAFRKPIFEFDKIVARTAVVVQAARLLNFPVLVTEQYPQTEYHVTMPLGIDDLILELLAKRVGHCVENGYRCESCRGTMRSGETMPVQGNITPVT